MTATVPIVTLNVSVTQAPTPSSLQQSGAFVTQGGTTETAGSLTPVATLAALQNILAASVAITSITWLSEVATVTTTTAHGWTDAVPVSVTIAGATPNGYNGTFSATPTGADTFTYPLTVNPGGSASAGTATLGAVAELLAMGTTYFAGLNQQSVSVLELGEGSVNTGVTALGTWITANPGEIYAYLVPREWDGNSDFLALVTQYEAPNKLTYFWTTMVLADITDNATPYTGIKSVLGAVEASQNTQAVTTIPATEFSLASEFATALSMNPNSTNRASPLQYTPLYGVTAYPQKGNTGTFQTLANASVGWVGTGAQGGLPSTNIVFQGLMQDGNQWLFWYSADWFQINSAQALANEVINGAQPGGNPLYYNQDGINRLQNRLVQTARQAVSAGLANGQVIATQLPFATFQANYNAGAYEGMIPINAEPFAVYNQENPNDYRIGKYGGLAAVYTPTLGFMNIDFALNITNLLIP
jgi:hypothetical protein